MPGVFDIIGPVIVGPSSSHTAGAARIGQVARGLAGGQVTRATITFYGSFADTWRGHGTDLAVAGGLLGHSPDDPAIRTSVAEAARRGVAIEFHTGQSHSWHPNTMTVDAEGPGGAVHVRASSVGGGSISLDEMDGFELGVSCALPTLVLPHNDHPGVIAAASAALATGGCNIASMKVSRSKRGGSAVAVIETDSDADAGTRAALANIPGVERVIHIPGV